MVAKPERTPPHVVRTPCPPRPKGLASETWATTTFNSLTSSFFHQAIPYSIAPLLLKSKSVHPFVYDIDMLKTEVCRLEDRLISGPKDGKSVGDSVYALHRLGIMQAWMSSDGQDQTQKDTLDRISQKIKTLTGAEPPRPSVGIKNEGDNCCLTSLMQGIMGDPITREHLIHAELSLDDPGIGVDLKGKVQAFFRELKTCCQEFESAQNKPLTILDFITRLRAALDLIILRPTERQDPAEILATIFSYIRPAENPLLPTLTTTKRFNLAELDGIEERLVKYPFFFDFCLGQLAQLIEESQESKAEESKAADLKDHLATCKGFSSALRDPLLQEIDCAFTEMIQQLTQEIGQQTPPRITEPLRHLIKKAQALKTNLKYVKKKGILKVEFSRPYPLTAFDISSHAEPESIESLCAANLGKNVESNSDANPSDVEGGTYETMPPHLLLALNQTRGSESRGWVQLKQTFSLDSKFSKDNQEGNYELRWFIVHSSNQESSERYVFYRKTAYGWYLFDNERVMPVNFDDIAREPQKCCLCFASKIDKPPSQLEERFKKEQAKPFPDKLGLMQLFKDVLSSKQPSPQLLEQIFHYLGVAAQEFIQHALGLNSSPSGEQLLKLKRDSQLRIVKDCIQLIENQRSTVQMVIDICETIFDEASYLLAETVSTIAQWFFARESD